MGDSRSAPAYDVVLRARRWRRCGSRSIARVDGEGGSGNDVAAGLSFFVERHARRGTGRPQRRPERLHLAPLPAPANKDGVDRELQHRRDERRVQSRSRTRAADDIVRDAVISHLIVEGKQVAR